MSKLRVIIEINYDMDRLDLPAVKHDLQKMIEGGTDHGRVELIYLEGRDAEVEGQVCNVILYEAPRHWGI